MIDHQVQPWGRAPTPLLPKSLVAELGHMAAPSSLRDLLGVQATLRDLNGAVWEHVDSVGTQTLKDVVESIRPVLSSLAHLSIRSGERLCRPVQDLPFSNRTRNRVSQDLERFTVRKLSFGDILAVPSFGVRGAIEFACVIEAAMERISSVVVEDASRQSTCSRASSTPQEIKSAFQMLAAYAAGERNVETLADVLPSPRDEWPPEIKHLWGSLGHVGTRDIAGELVKRYAVPELMSEALAPLDERLREIVAERITATERAVTLEALGERMGVTRERIRQLEKKALFHLERVRTSKFRPVIRRAQAVRVRLGVGVLADDKVLQDTLDWATEDIHQDSDISPKFAGALLLWLAGPYKKRQGWLLAERHLEKLTLDALLDRRDDRGRAPSDAIYEVLTQFGFNEKTHAAWLGLLRNFLEVDGGYLYFTGSIPEKFRTLLRFHQRPISIEEIVDLLGSSSIRSVRQRLIDDSGFWRINKQSEFVIAGTPGYDEYTGITDEIVQEIEACGGRAPFDHLVEKLTRVYGVKENSVVAYINAPIFTKDENGFVGVRDSEIAIDASRDITKVAGCYQKPDGSWFWRILVDKDIVRGSGRLVPNAFAKEVGCGIGDKIKVDTTEGKLTFSWPLTSTTGATIGSLRSALVSCGAELGDYLFVCATKPKVSFERLSKHTLDSAGTVLERLCLIIGAGEADRDNDATTKIATALGITRGEDDSVLVECRRQLNARGESDLAEMIASPTLSIDDYVANMGKLFDR